MEESQSLTDANIQFRETQSHGEFGRTMWKAYGNISPK
jgi:hypothetical protein